MSSNGNYHSQQRRYFAGLEGGSRLHGQPQQSLHDAAASSLTPANGLPQTQTGAAKNSSDSFARLHHYNYGQLRNCSQANQQQQQQPPCHFYGPIESMSTHRANSNNNHNLASAPTHHRQDRPTAVFAADPTPGPVNFGEHNNNFNSPSARARANEHYSDRARSHHHKSNNNNYFHHQNQHHEHQNHDQMSCQTNQEQRRLSECHCPSDRSLALEQRHQDCDRDQYANQLRRNQVQQRIGSHNNRSEAPINFHGAAPRQQMLADDGQKAQTTTQPTMRHQDQKAGQQQQASGSSSGASQQQQQPLAKELLHVNFNRSSQAIGAGGKETDDDESGESTRKKKYLTAKYGQQQMNLIKKRLKIEMWLHDQLQELAKESKTIEPDELDEIDIDLDQLLDMDDDSTRRRWLSKTLEPLSGLPNESLEKFIDQVLEQSKLL